MESGIILIQSMGRNLLVDTGSPISFGDFDYAEIGGRMHRLGWNPLLNEIRKCLGQGVSGLIGMDILSQYNMGLFPDGAGYLRPEITESDICCNFKDGKSGELYTLIGIPVVLIDVKGVNCRFFLDTGADATYISSKLSAAFNKTGSMEDFYPIQGTFKTDTCDFQASILGYPFTVTAGILPDFLESLFPGEIHGVLGRDVLGQFSICLGFKSGKFYLKR